MNIALVTIAYNNYGQFIDQWLGFINNSTLKPKEIVVVLGVNHGCENPQKLTKKYSRLPIKFIETKSAPTMGRYRNLAVKHTSTEWVMYLSVDDMLLPDCLSEVAKVEAQADYVSLSWIVRGLGLPDAVKIAKTPQDCRENNGKGFILGHSPFRRSFWQKIPYENHDYPNAPFIIGMLKQNARFVKILKPGTVYLRRPDSHSKTVLQGENKIKSEKRKAVFYKKQLEDYIRKNLNSF